MIPFNFSQEYLERCGSLIRFFKETAKNEDLLGSFSIMAAYPLFLIPYERTYKNNEMVEERERFQIQRKIRKLARMKLTHPEISKNFMIGNWTFFKGVDPIEDIALGPIPTINFIDKVTLEKVLYVLRNALGHGNLIYLNKNKRQIVSDRVEFLAFLSRADPEKPEKNHNCLIIPEKEFLPFVLSWAKWLEDNWDDDGLDLAA